MITFEEIREKYPPRKVFTQKEFDDMMNAIRREQNEATAPSLERMDRLNQIRREIGWKMAQLNIELGNVNREREILKEELKRTNGIFFGLKKQLIQANPRIVPQPREDAQ